MKPRNTKVFVLQHPNHLYMVYFTIFTDKNGYTLGNIKARIKEKNLDDMPPFISHNDDVNVVHCFGETMKFYKYNWYLITLIRNEWITLRKKGFELFTPTEILV